MANWHPFDKRLLTHYYTIYKLIFPAQKKIGLINTVRNLI